MINGFSGIGAALAGAGGQGDNYLRMALAAKQQQEQEAAFNPLRQAVLQQLTQQQEFAGGPANELAMPNGAPAVAPPAPAQATNGGPQPMQQSEPVQGVPTPPPQIDAILKQAADKNGIPVNMLRALAAQESGFNPAAVNQATPGDPTDPGAIGLMQYTKPTAESLGIDPTDPMQSADAAAAQIKQRLDAGVDPLTALAQHFSGPDPAQVGPNTQRYKQEIDQKLKAYEKSFPTMLPDGRPLSALAQAGPQAGAQAGAPGSVPVPAGGKAGPFGTVLTPSQADRSPIAKMIASASQDPRAFAQLFASEGGFKTLLSGTGALGTQPGAPGTGSTRLLRGDTAEGQAVGLQPGERGRVKGTIAEDGSFFPTEVMGNPISGAGAEGNGILTTLYNGDTNEVVSLRRNDPKVDELIGQGYLVASDGRQLEQLRSMSQSEKNALKESQISATNYISTVGDALLRLQESPDVNTWIARGAAFVNDLKQETRALGRALGMTFDESIFDVGANQETFKQLGISSNRMQSLITSLAFQRAAAEKGSNGRVTNRDIERFVKEIGAGSGDTTSLVTILRDTAERTKRSFETNYKVRTGEDFQGDLGIGALPDFDAASLEQAPTPQASGQAPGAEAASVPEGLPQGSSPTGQMTVDGGEVWVDPDGTKWVVE